MARQYGISGSGDSGGGYIDLPDQPTDSGGQMQAQPDYGAAQRDAIAQAMMAQQALRAQQMQWSQTPSFAQVGSGTDGSQFGAASRGWDGSVTTPESAALMLQDPAAYYAKYGGAPDYHGMTPQEYGSLFTPRPMPSGGVDEQSPKLFGWAGYSDPGRAPGGILPFYGNGASAYANPDYWFGNGPGAQSLRGGNNPRSDALAYMQATNPQRYQQLMEQEQQNMQLYGSGPGNSGAAGMGGMGGVGGAPSSGISDAELGRAVTDVNSQRGQPAQEFSLSPFSHGFETYGRSAQDYNPVNDPYSFDAFSTQQSVMQQSHQAAEAMNAVQQAAQDAADDAEADEADGSAY
jgi:hypothetical protein